ncbi:MAG TPA: biopolymer transporter ExbD [Gammaproteobacteria bacterium]|nr:biopolymer transporter ExbD [Gammaproteobacteria bacterium]
MNLLSRSKEEPEINLTSLIDVVLLLLVFFMVSTSFVREAEINIRLPEASAEPLDEQAPDVLEIGITANGNYLLNGRQLLNSDRRRLRAAIERVMGDRRDVDVIVRADAESKLQAAVTAMNVAGELGFTSINIATVTTAESR